MVIAPTYPILARATAPTLVEAFRGTDLQGRYVPSKNRYYLPGGGVLWLISADRPQGLEGGQVWFVWLDEIGQMKFSAWIAVQGRIGQKQGRALGTTTPYPQYRWLNEDWIARFLKGDSDYFVRRWSSHENPAYPQAEYDRAKRTMPDWLFRMRYDGEYTRPSGLVYPDLDTCLVDPVDPPAGRLVGGIDFGYAKGHPFAALAGTLYTAENGDDVLYIWYERYKSLTRISEHAAALPPDVEWWADPSEPDQIRELRVAGHTVRKAHNPILLGIQAVSERIYTRRLKASRRCRALIGEADLHHWPDDEDKVPKPVPVDENNHTLDALRYLVMGLDRRRIAQRKAG